MRLDGDRRGYVIAIADTTVEALERAEAAARLLEVEVDVSCASTSTHYRELLEAAQAGGYRFAFFEGDAAARRPAPAPRRRPLARRGARGWPSSRRRRARSATYFLMTGSVFYNLDSREGERAIARLRELGHRVGLHAVYPRVDLDERFDPVLAWHNPDPEYMRAPVDGAINVMEPPWFDPETYRSDSNQHWRSGCPHEELRAGAFAWLQLLTHPEIWVYPGATMGETMRAMLEEEKERRLDQLAADRIDLS